MLMGIRRTPPIVGAAHGCPLLLLGEQQFRGARKDKRFISPSRKSGRKSRKMEELQSSNLAEPLASRLRMAWPMYGKHIGKTGIDREPTDAQQGFGEVSGEISVERGGRLTGSGTVDSLTVAQGGAADPIDTNDQEARGARPRRMA
jgi:hypothetical protein